MEEQDKKKASVPGKISKNVLNVIRTTMRNNIELTHIADNKANVLLSLNALMLTFLLPMIIANFDMIVAKNLGLSLVIFIITSLLTIYLAALALKPGDFRKLEQEKGNEAFNSPFFFGNHYNMSSKEFQNRIEEALINDDIIRKHVLQDLYYIGARLGQKMTIIRNAFNLLLAGLILSVLAAAASMLFFQ